MTDVPKGDTPAAGVPGTGKRVRFLTGEKLRFSDSDLSFQSKSLLYEQRTASLTYDPDSQMPFPHFHIPTREEEWAAMRAEAVQAAHNRAANSTPGSRKRKITPASSPAPTTPESTRRSSRKETPSAKEEESDADEPDEATDDDDADAEVDADDAAEEDDGKSSVDAASSASKRRGRPKGSKNKPKDPELALAFEMAQEEEGPTVTNNERLTQRQRALLLEGEEQHELLSLPNRPLKSKGASEMTEEQLARKAAANERRKNSEKERMEKEKSDTIQKLLMNAPSSKKVSGAVGASASASSPAEQALGAIPAPARIRATRTKKGAKGAGAGAEEEEEVDEGDADEDAGEEEEAKEVTVTVDRRTNYSRTRIVYRNYLQIDAEESKRTTPDDDGDVSAASAPFVPPVAHLRCSVSFPLPSPLPPPPLFAFADSVSQLAAFRRTQRHNDNEADPDEPNERGDQMEIDAEAATTEASAATHIASPAAVDPAVAAAAPSTRPSCARPSCTSIRRYTDSSSHLPICSLACLQQLRATTIFQNAVDKQANSKLQTAA